MTKAQGPLRGVKRTFQQYTAEQIDTAKVHMEETVTITLKEYESLKEDSDFLAALQSAGVDNWDGYSYALELQQEWAEENDNL